MRVRLCVQRKLTTKEESNDEERLLSRPAWVLDHNLANLWSEGMDEDTIPEDLRLTAGEAAKIKRLQAWAEEQVAELEQAEVEQPRPQPQLPVPVVDGSAAFVTPVSAPVSVPVVAPVRFDPAVLARVAALKAGPVCVSPATVLEM